jgi:hypothetical protein
MIRYPRIVQKQFDFQQQILENSDRQTEAVDKQTEVLKDIANSIREIAMHRDQN